MNIPEKNETYVSQLQTERTSSIRSTVFQVKEDIYFHI